MAGDLITIDWESSALDTEIKLAPMGTTDFTLFQVSPVAEQGLPSNGKSHLTYTAPQAGIVPLYFRVCDGTPGPYDFTAVDQHGLAVASSPFAHIKTTTTFTGTANLTNGAPAPDGLLFTLTVTWPGGAATYSAASSGGTLAFPMALPETAGGKKATFVISRAADTVYQATSSAKLEVPVAKVKPPGPTPCEIASRRMSALAIKSRRLSRQARHAHGNYRLHRRAAQAKRKLRAARAEVDGLCRGA